MQLSRNQQQQIIGDRRALADRGLKMPRLSQKYLAGIYRLAQLGQTSPYFYHLHAARHGRSFVFDTLEKLGYLWNGDDWILPKLHPTSLSD